MKRYAIVRVDKDYYLNSCPAGFEEINNDFVCAYRKDKVLNQYVHNCKNCRYGDTKEQLIRKVATVLRRILKVDVCSYKYKGKMRKLETIRFKGKGRFDEIVIELEEAATKIVEFLGVEE